MSVCPGWTLYLFVFSPLVLSSMDAFLQGASFSVVAPKGVDDGRVANPAPIASPGLEDVFLDSGKTAELY